MAHPQIAIFARMAKGNTPPVRVIAGQITRLGRTMHAIHYDPIHDELVVSNPFAQAILTFPGNANGEVAPLRVLQGPSTGLDAPDRFSIDPVHNEIYVGQGHEILVFSRTADGDAAPIRRLTGQWSVRETDADPIHNLIIAAGSPDGRAPRSAILFFDRNSNGEVRPKSVIRGPHTGLEGLRQIQAYPPKGRVFVSNTLDNDQWKPGSYFVGVWSIYDHGDVPPRWRIGGPQSQLKRARGVAIDPAHQEVIVADMLRNAILTFYFPEVFRSH